MKKSYWLALGAVLLAIQLIRIETTNPPIDPTRDIRQILQMPSGVEPLLTAACYDCHSDETKYPWYSHVAPVSWFVGNHIREGREHLNFSTFGQLSAEDQAEALDEAAEKIREGEMPLKSYVWIHPEASLSPEQKDILIRWFQANSGEAEATNGGNNKPREEKGDDD